jgi:hypothetical protein
MPLPGQGAVPTGALYNELTAATRRAFVPRLFVQIYFATPTLFYLLGAANKSAGGLSQITIPIQGQSMVQGQFTGYGGGFNSPVITPGVQNAQFPTCYWVVPVPLPFGESVIQATDREISLLKARMNDVWSVTVQNMGGLVFSNNTANSLLPNSFVDAFDNGTTVAVYGGINRTTPGNTSWKGNSIAAAGITSGTGTVATVGFTRAAMSSALIQITDLAGGEAPTFGVLAPGDFATLNKDFVGTEQIFTRPGSEYTMATAVRSAFPNLNVAGVPIFADHFVPQGTAYFGNAKYTNMYLSEDAAFDFSGFYSLVPLGQIGQQGVVVTGYNIVTAKPSANAVITGIGGNQF